MKGALDAIVMRIRKIPLTLLMKGALDAIVMRIRKERKKEKKTVSSSI